MNKFPIFPISIEETDFDKHGETSHGAGVIFTDGINQESHQKSQVYILNVFGQDIKGVVVEDFEYGIRARLEYPRIQLRQMKIYLLNDVQLSINHFISISYYLLSNGTKECIFVLSRKR